MNCEIGIYYDVVARVDITGLRLAMPGLKKCVRKNCFFKLPVWPEIMQHFAVSYYKKAVLSQR